MAAVLHPSIDSAIRMESGCPKNTGTGVWKERETEALPAIWLTAPWPMGSSAGCVVSNTDMGMAVAPGQDATVFVGRPGRWEAKSFVAAFYGSSAKHGYFAGCSTGGEQAWMEAQRHRDDNDGIVAGAPANNRTGGHESILWNFATTERTPQDHISTAKFRWLAETVTAACDWLDGVEDGIINDPRKCSFDPASVACSTAGKYDCLRPGR